MKNSFEKYLLKLTSQSIHGIGGLDCNFGVKGSIILKLVQAGKFTKLGEWIMRNVFVNIFV